MQSDKDTVKEAIDQFAFTVPDTVKKRLESGALVPARNRREPTGIAQAARTCQYRQYRKPLTGLLTSFG